MSNLAAQHYNEWFERRKEGFTCPHCYCLNQNVPFYVKAFRKKSFLSSYYDYGYERTVSGAKCFNPSCEKNFFIEVTPEKKGSDKTNNKILLNCFESDISVINLHVENDSPYIDMSEQEVDLKSGMKPVSVTIKELQEKIKKGEFEDKKKDKNGAREIEMQLPEELIEFREAAEKLYGKTGSEFEFYKRIMQERDNLIEIMEGITELKSQKFYENILLTKKLVDGKVGETNKLIDEKFRLERVFYQSALDDGIDYVNRREGKIKEKEINAKE